MTDAWKYGSFGGYRIGDHFLMPRSVALSGTVYGVWVLRARNRTGEGCAELLAEFQSKRFATAWAKQRNTPRSAK